MDISNNLFNFPRWSATKYLNRWSDYIELRCVASRDSILTIDDLLDDCTEIDSKDEFALERGEHNHASKVDSIHEHFESYFSFTRKRLMELKSYYPFKINDKNCIECDIKNLTNEQFIYVFLLAASNTTYFNEPSILTTNFEAFCARVLYNLNPSGSITRIFGTSDSFYKGNLRVRLTQLAEDLHINTTKAFDADPQFDVPAGDGGLDVISFFPLDNCSYIPLSFAQCSCSYEDWMNKQSEVSYDIWNNRFEKMIPYIPVIFVPFFVRCSNWGFEKETSITTCLIDRQRILHLIEKDKQFLEQESSIKAIAIAKMLCQEKA